jgi:hypothetical protein
MPDLRQLPLDGLIAHCPPLRLVISAQERAAWAELQRRALCNGNSAAWDLLLLRSWSTLLFWIYEQAPETAPARAEQLAQQVLHNYKRLHRRNTPYLRSLHSYETLVAELQQSIRVCMLMQL